MSIVVIMDGFKYEGWKNLSNLFEPSLYSDGIKIFYETDENLDEIDDLLSNHNDTVIYLVPIMDYQGEITHQIESYQYKYLMERIKGKFPFSNYSKNIIFTIDLTSDNSYQNPKFIAEELDKKGYINDSSCAPHLFSKKCLNEISEIYHDFINSIKVSNKFTEAEKNKFIGFKENFIQYFENQNSDKQNLQSTNSIQKSNSSSIYQSIVEIINQSCVNDLEKDKLSILKSITKAIFDHYSIQDQLNDFILVEYKYTDEINTVLFLNVYSLISIVHNIKNEFRHRNWYKVASIDTNYDLLSDNLNKLIKTKIQNKIENKFSVEVNNLQNIDFGWSESKISQPNKNEISIPVFNSYKVQENFKIELESYHKGIDQTIKSCKTNLSKIKENIFHYQVDKLSKEYNLDQLKQKSKLKLKTQNIEYKDSIKDVESSFNNINLDGFFKNAISVIRKLPTFLTFCIVVPLTITLFILLPIFIVNKLQDNIGVIIALYSLYLLASGIVVFRMRKIIKSIVNQYHHKIFGVINRLKNWESNAKTKFETMFFQKLKEENQQNITQFYKRVSTKIQKISCHQSNLDKISNQARYLLQDLNLDFRNSDEYKLDVDLNKPPSQIAEYSIFPSKINKPEITIDATQVIKNISFYGVINQATFNKVNVGDVVDE